MTRDLEIQRAPFAVEAPDQVRGAIHLWLTKARHALRVTHFVYILASRPFGAIYTGRSHNLRHRVEAHRAGLSQHTDCYNIKTLVWFEAHNDFDASLKRERSLKRWRRDWKLKLITDANPDWRDLTYLIPD